jgi:DNA mismatch repair protein MutS2
MNAKALKTLEYDKIISMLKKETGSSASLAMAEDLRPFCDVHTVQEKMEETSEALKLILMRGRLPSGGSPDISKEVHLAAIGGSLSMGQLLDIRICLKIAEDVRRFFYSDETPDDLPVLEEMIELVETLPDLEHEIDRCILSEDEMADTASPKLKNIRRSIGNTNESIRARLNQIVSSSRNKTYLRDQIITMRDGRYVIPVKQEYRSMVPGLVHDQSKAGSTLFIEPKAVVDMNNSLRELELEEQREIGRILSALSSEVAQNADLILNNQRLIASLDFIMAKGMLSYHMDAARPVVTEKGPLKLIKARHPLIEKDKVVPLDISVGDGYNTLIITGPNTGGKTVSLKTAGLLSLMAMSGLHLPCGALSRVPIYKEVFADIGDEQSIEQSLSTFSSHMKNIVKIIEKTDENALVLLDELGAGTDPTEGAALAIAILEKLGNSKAHILATTHYAELKKYALSTPGVMNAAMEFNIETLSPTFRLEIGIPGKSNAFAISEKLGLKEDIIRRAVDLIQTGDIEFENILAEIEENQIKAREDREEAERILQDVRDRSAELAKKEADMNKKRDQLILQAEEEARTFIKDAEETSKRVKKDLQTMMQDGSKVSAREYADINRKINQAKSLYAGRSVRQVNKDPVSIDEIEIGDRVKILTMDQTGEVYGLPDDAGNMIVRVGNIKVNVNAKDLMIINEGNKKKKSGKKKNPSYGSLYKSKALNISPELDVRGENLESALMEVDKYLDDVYMAGLGEISIIHGRGSGILRSGIRDYLKKHPKVDSFARARYDRGGEGVTVVSMKKD